MRHASGHNYRNSSFIVDVAMGQIPRSTERISSLVYFSTCQFFRTVLTQHIHERVIRMEPDDPKFQVKKILALTLNALVWLLLRAISAVTELLVT